MNSNHIKQYLLLIVFSLLQACGGSGSNGNSSGSIKALVDGEVSSALYEHLNSQYLSVTTYDGTQNITDYDVVITDTNTSVTERLVGEEKPVRQALLRHVPVLLFNVNDPKVEQKLSELTNLSFGGRNLAYLIDSDCDQRNKPAFHVSPFREMDISVAQDATTERETEDVFIAGKAPKTFKHGDDVSVLSQLFDTYSNQIVERLNSSARGQCQNQGESQVIATKDSTDTNVTPPPDQIPYLHRVIHWDFPVTVGGTTGFTSAVEDTHIDFTVDVYYDNSNSPPEYQVFVFQDGQVYVDQNQLLEGTKVNLRLLQREFWTNYSLSGENGIFSTVFAPSNVNQSESVTNTVSQSISATVGYQTASATGSYSTSRSVTQEITQWNIENSSPNSTSREWHYYQAIFASKFEKEPAISRQNLSYQNVALWILPGDTKSFTLTANPARRFSNYVIKKGGAKQIFTDIVYATPQEVTIDLTALPNAAS
jgi:hypothetical protein